MFQKIDNLILLGIKVTFLNYYNGFKIKLAYEDKTEFVVLPYDHLNEDKIVKYLSFMQDKILTNKSN